MINSVYQTSFKGFIPITYYARNPKDGKYWQVTKKPNLRKCQSFIVRNLNGTAKNIRSQAFIDFYGKYDKDYQKCRQVHSVYDNESPTVYMITGNDVDKIKNLARPIGKARSESMFTLGHSNSFEAKSEANYFFKQVKSFLKHDCKQITNEDGDKLSLKVYFNPKYNREGKVKAFNYVEAELVKEPAK